MLLYKLMKILILKLFNFSYKYLSFPNNIKLNYIFGINHL